MRQLAPHLTFACLSAMLFLAITVSVAHAAPSANKPIINPLNPNSGNEGTSVSITGDNLGNGGFMVATGLSYVRFGGFINTTINSWSSSRVSVAAPSLQDALSDYSKVGLVWTIGDIFSADLLSSLEFLAKSPAALEAISYSQKDTAVNVAIVSAPGGQSNEETFTYLARPPSNPISTLLNTVGRAAEDAYVGSPSDGLYTLGCVWLNNVAVGGCNDFLHTQMTKIAQDYLQQTVRSVVEIPQFFNSVFQGKDSSWPVAPQDTNMRTSLPSTNHQQSQEQQKRVVAPPTDKTSVQSSKPAVSTPSQRVSPANLAPSQHSLDQNTAQQLLSADLQQDMKMWQGEMVIMGPSGGYLDAGLYLTDPSIATALQQLGLVTLRPQQAYFAVEMDFTPAAAPYLIKNASGNVTYMVLAKPSGVTVDSVSPPKVNSYPCGAASQCLYEVSYTVTYTKTPFERAYDQYEGRSSLDSPLRGPPINGPQHYIAAMYQQNSCWEVLAASGEGNTPGYGGGYQKICPTN